MGTLPSDDVRITDFAVLTLTGDLDLAVADSVVTAGTALCRRSGVGRLVVDMAEVTFIDSSGIAALLRLRRLLQPGCELRVVGARPRVRLLTDLTGVSALLGLDEPVRGGVLATG